MIRPSVGRNPLVVLLLVSWACTVQSLAPPPPWGVVKMRSLGKIERFSTLWREWRGGGGGRRGKPIKCPNYFVRGCSSRAFSLRKWKGREGHCHFLTDEVGFNKQRRKRFWLLTMYGLTHIFPIVVDLSSSESSIKTKYNKHEEADIQCMTLSAE